MIVVSRARDNEESNSGWNLRNWALPERWRNSNWSMFNFVKFDQNEEQPGTSQKGGASGGVHFANPLYDENLKSSFA